MRRRRAVLNKRHTHQPTGSLHWPTDTCVEHRTLYYCKKFRMRHALILYQIDTQQIYFSSKATGSQGHGPSSIHRYAKINTTRKGKGKGSAKNCVCFRKKFMSNLERKNFIGLIYGFYRNQFVFKKKNAGSKKISHVQKKTLVCLQWCPLSAILSYNYFFCSQQSTTLFF